MIGTILIFLLIFFIIVMGHEFGHFLIAKVNGIRVNEFAIGMAQLRSPALKRVKQNMCSGRFLWAVRVFLKERMVWRVRMQGVIPVIFRMHPYGRG